MAGHVTGSAGICKKVAGAGDENRTRTISLGIRPIQAATAVDLAEPGTASSRD